MSVPRALAAAFTAEQLAAGVANAARRQRPVEAANCLVALHILDPEAAARSRRIFLAWSVFELAIR